jgi:hypothetical protein
MALMTSALKDFPSSQGTRAQPGTIHKGMGSIAGEHGISEENSPSPSHPLQSGVHRRIWVEPEVTGKGKGSIPIHGHREMSVWSAREGM